MLFYYLPVTFYKCFEKFKTYYSAQILCKIGEKTLGMDITDFKSRRQIVKFVVLIYN